MSSDDTKARNRIARFGDLLYRRGYAHGTTGNISVRLDDGSIMVTPTNSCLGLLDPESLSRIDASGRHLAGDPPSKEGFLHLAMYAERPSARAIVHLHCTHAVALSCCCHQDPSNVLPPLTAYHVMRVGRLPLVPYHRPGDVRLAEAVRAVARDHHAVLLANHGPVVAGRTLEDAVFSAEELEETARLFFLLEERRRDLWMQNRSPLSMPPSRAEAMLVVTVRFDIRPDRLAAFMPLMLRNARESLAGEPGCRTFDVCTSQGEDGAVFLYEVYDDRAAFDDHLASAHFLAFDAATRAMVASKAVRFWRLEYNSVADA